MILFALAPPASAAGAGVGQFTFSSACPDDVTTFTLEDNGDGTWSFTIGDVGMGLCAWAHSDELVGVGSPSTGFDGTLGNVDSGAWTLNADGTFSVTGLTFTFPSGSGVGLGGGYAITGDASGVLL